MIAYIVSTNHILCPLGLLYILFTKAKSVTKSIPAIISNRTSNVPVFQ